MDKSYGDGATKKLKYVIMEEKATCHLHRKSPKGM